MRKFQIIGIIVCLLLVAGLTVFQLTRNGSDVKKRQPKGKTAVTTQISTQESQTLASTQIETPQTTQESQTAVGTQESGGNPAAGPQINNNKIEERFTQAPYNLTFSKVEESDGKKTVTAAAESLTIVTTQNDDGLDSARITVPLKNDYSDIDNALKLVGEFAETINRNITDNDNQTLKNMFDLIKTPATGGGQTTQRDADGLTLTMTITGGSGGSGGGGGGSSGTDDSDDESGSESELTVIIEEPPVAEPIPENILFLSDSLNKNGPNGTWEITGEVINTNETYMTGIQVRAVLYDSFNAVLDTQNGWVSTPLLEANAQSPFIVRIYNPPADFDHYVLSIPPAG